MPLTNITTAKELSQSYQPILLVEITFNDSSVLRLSTHDFQSATTGVQFNGHDYLPRLLNTPLSTISALSSLGVDTIPQVNLKIADSDKTIWQNFESTQGRGFRGASIVMRLVFYDVVAKTFSTDNIVKFTGICESPSNDDETLSVKAMNRLNFAKSNLPSVQFQRICPWSFPDTSQPGLTTPQAQAIRQAAADDRTSPSWNCGYSPDASGGNARGNYQSGTTPYTTCDLSPQSCMARMGNPSASGKSYGGVPGDITQDTSSRATARFGGITWPIPTTWSGIAYGQSKATQYNFNWDNTPLFNTYLPLIYGTCLVYPTVTNVVGDPNSTRGECIVNQGPVQQIYSFNINDHDIQPTNSLQQMTSSFPVSDKLRRYTVITTGDRTGDTTKDVPYNGTGDPTGGMCKIEWCVYSNESPSSSPPTIRMVVQGTKVAAIQAFSSIASGVLTVIGTNTNYGEGTQVTILGTGTSLDGVTFQTLNNSSTTLQLVGCTSSTGPGYMAGAINDTAQNLGSTVSGVTFDAFDQPINVNGQAANPIWVLLDVMVKGGLSYQDIDIPSWIAAANICDRQINYTGSDGSTQTHALYSTGYTTKDPTSIADIIRGIRLSCKATLRPTGSGATGGLLGVQIDQTLADQQPTPDSTSNYSTAVTSIDHTGSVTSGYVKYAFDESNILRNGKKSTLEITQQPINNSYNSVTFSFQDANNSYVVDSVTIRDSADINNIGQEVNYALPVLGVNSYDHARRIGAWFVAKGLQGNPRGDSSGTWYAKFQTSARAEHLQIGDLIWLSSTHIGFTHQLFRVTSITPAADWETMTIEASWHLDQWYTDGFGQAGFQLLPQTTAALQRPPFPWSPAQDGPVNVHDPFGNYLTFDIAQQYSTVDLNGNIQPQIVVNGVTPTTNISQQAIPPLFDLVPMVTTGGGTISGNAAYAIALCTLGSDGFWSTPSRVANVGIPAASTNNSITLTGLDWQAFSLNGAVVTPTGYGIFAGPDNNHMTLQGTPDTSGTFPSTVTLTSYAPGTVALPDPQFDHFRTKIFIGRHTGSFGGQITARTSSTITCNSASWTANAFVGRVCSIIAEFGSTSVTPKNYTITANTTNTLTVTGNPVTDGVAIDDVLVVRLGVSSATSNTLTESAWNGCGAPMDVDAEAGKTLRIFQGTGKGQMWPIVSNTADTITINGAFNPLPDSTSVWMVHETSVFDFADSPSMPVTMNVANEAGSTIVVEVDTVDSFGNECVNNLSPVRDCYLYGCQGTRTISTSSTQLSTDYRLFCDSTTGSFTLTLLPRAQVVNQQLLVQKISTDTNTITVQCSTGDTFSDGTTGYQLVNLSDSIFMQF